MVNNMQASQSTPRDIVASLGAKVQHFASNPADIVRGLLGSNTTTYRRQEPESMSYVGPYSGNNAQVSGTADLTKLADQTEGGYNLPKGMLDHVLFRESSRGVKRTNQSWDVGEYGWLTGFTHEAKKQLNKEGIAWDANSPEGAIKASADYLTYLKDNYDLKDMESLYAMYNLGPTGYFKKFGKPKK